MNYKIKNAFIKETQRFSHNRYRHQFEISGKTAAARNFAYRRIESYRRRREISAEGFAEIKFRRTNLKNMTKILVANCLILFISTLCVAQNAKNEELKSAAEIPDRLFAALKAKSFEDLRAVFTPEGQLLAIDKPRDGKGISKTRVFTAESFAKAISEAKGADYIEKMPNKDVRVTGDLAIVSGRYTFYVGEKFSHCGTNTFNLVRTETGWRIANAASTLEFQCERDLKAVEIPAIEADPADVSTIDGIVKAFYEVVSGGKGIPRQWSRDRTLYTPDIRFVAMSEEGGKIRASVMSHSQYVNGANEYFLKEGFQEREINRVVRRFGNIAQIFSTYEFSTDDGKEKGRGINSLELFWDGARWWISATSWDEERPGNPIPKEFLKGKK